MTKLKRALEIDRKGTLGWFVGFGFFIAMCAVWFRLKIPFLLILGVAGVFFVPSTVIAGYERKRHHRRFLDVSSYMEQMLYSFRESRKVLKSLLDMRELFDDGEMKDALVRAAQTLIEDTEGDSMTHALETIEDEYPCEKLHMMHSFLVEVEEIGGDFDDSIDILQEDRAMWTERVLALEKERDAKRINVILSIAASILLCIVMDRVLPSDVNTMDMPVAQIVTTVMIILDMKLYTMAEKKVCMDYLNPQEIMDDESTLHMYRFVKGYDAKKQLKKAAKGLILPGAMLLAGVSMRLYAVEMAALLMVPFVLLRPKLTYRSYMKKLEKQMQVKFPHWLMEVALIIQTNTVRNAIRMTQEDASVILKPELTELIQGFEEDPTSIRPYLDFCKDYRLSEVSASMKMLYSISNGSGSEPARQIAEIIRRNNVMLDKAEKMANEDSLAGLYAMFLAPQLISGGKILVDMCLFFVLFFTRITL